MSTPNTQQALFLNALRKQQIPVSLFMTNGIRLEGYLVSFDRNMVALQSNGVTQAVYKHAISVVVPVNSIDLHAGEPEG